jgi:hypothetical protein
MEFLCFSASASLRVLYRKHSTLNNVRHIHVASSRIKPYNFSSFYSLHSKPPVHNTYLVSAHERSREYEKYARGALPMQIQTNDLRFADQRLMARNSFLRTFFSTRHKLSQKYC